MNILLKESIRKIIRMTPYYKSARQDLYIEDNVEILKTLLRESVDNVPFYRKLNLNKETLSLKDFPIIRKNDIMNHEDEFVSEKYNKKYLRQKETGGSTGKSLKVYYPLELIIKKNAYTNYVFSLIGKNLKVAMLRGVRPKDGKIYQKISADYYVLSSYLMSSENIDEYIDYIKKEKINCLHVYPSAISIFARFVKHKYGQLELPELKGILSSSEIFSVEEKQFVKSVFPNVKIIDFYGQNEQVCCAYAVDNDYYKFFPTYGRVEFVDTGEFINGNRIAEIVATGLLNKAMPFIRYGTDDYVELDSQNRIVSIIGRTSDFVYNKKGELSPCMLNTRDISMVNVTNFQYYQPAVGQLTFRVMVTPEFSEQDRKYLLEDMEDSFNGAMDCSVEVVTDIQRTKRGKQMRLVQDVIKNR